MRQLAAFVRLSRLKFLIAGLTGYGLGAALAAYDGFPVSAAPYALGQAMVTAFHLMTHYTNEYFDRRSDRHGRPTPFAGGSGVLTSGALGPATALSAGIACAGLGCAAAAWLAATGAPAAAALGGLIALGAWSYSGPPLRLAASGWGEVDAVLVVAILVPLAGYAAFGGEPIGRAVAATVAPALATFAFMLSVEWPDRAADAASGKRNLLVRLGPRAAARLAALTALLVVPVLGLTIVYGAPRSLAVFALLLVPVVVGFVRCALARDPAPLEIAARGVSLIVLTLIYELLGYLSVLNPAQLPRPS